MNKALIAVFGVILSVALFCSLNYAQDVGQAKRPNEEDATPVEWGNYEYVISSTLDEKQEEYIGKYIRFVDELCVLWDESTPHDSKEEQDETARKGYKGEHDNQTFKGKFGYVKFDTNYFRCFLPKEFQTSVKYITDLNADKNFQDVKKRRARRKLMYIYGKLVRTTLYGDVETRDDPTNDTKPEEVVVMVHRIKKPAERFFKDEPNEEDQ
jgi:hypothetical protein